MKPLKILTCKTLVVMLALKLVDLNPHNKKEGTGLTS